MYLAIFVTRCRFLWLSLYVARVSTTPQVEAEVGKPQVAYRETITEPIELWYTHKTLRRF